MFLVTGGAGFIGSHTVAHLRALGHGVRVLDDLSSGAVVNLAGLDVDLRVGSITDPEAVERALEGVTHVIHLAARISVPESCAAPLAYDEVNGHGFVRVLEGARQAGVRRVVFASSCAVYGSLPGLPKREDAALAPESPYAATKLANEAWASAYARALGLSVVGLRYFNVFGPRQDPSGPYGAVIPRFVDRALAGRSLTIYGDGEQSRDFVHVSDVARANVAACLAEGLDGVYNIGGGRATTVNELAEAVRAEVGPGVVIEHLPERAGDVRHSRAELSRAAPWWTPVAPFDEALADTVRWFRARR